MRKEGLHPGTLKGVTAEPVRKVRAKGHENLRKAAGDAHGARWAEPPPVLSTRTTGLGSGWPKQLPLCTWRSPELPRAEKGDWERRGEVPGTHLPRWVRPRTACSKWSPSAGTRRREPRPGGKGRQVRNRTRATRRTQPGSGCAASDDPDAQLSASLSARGPAPLPVNRDSLKVFRHSSLVSENWMPRWVWAFQDFIMGRCPGEKTGRELGKVELLLWSGPQRGGGKAGLDGQSEEGSAKPDWSLSGISQPWYPWGQGEGRSLLTCCPCQHSAQSWASPSKGPQPLLLSLWYAWPCWHLPSGLIRIFKRLICLLMWRKCYLRGGGSAETSGHFAGG